MQQQVPVVQFWLSLSVTQHYIMGGIALHDRERAIDGLHVRMDIPTRDDVQSRPTERVVHIITFPYCCTLAKDSILTIR